MVVEQAIGMDFVQRLEQKHGELLAAFNAAAATCTDASLHSLSSSDPSTLHDDSSALSSAIAAEVDHHRQRFAARLASIKASKLAHPRTRREAGTDTLAIHTNGAVGAAPASVPPPAPPSPAVFLSEQTLLLLHTATALLGGDKAAATMAIISILSPHAQSADALSLSVTRSPHGSPSSTMAERASERPSPSTSSSSPAPHSPSDAPPSPAQSPYRPSVRPSPPSPYPTSPAPHLIDHRRRSFSSHRSPQLSPATSPHPPFRPAGAAVSSPLTRQHLVDVGRTRKESKPPASERVEQQEEEDGAATTQLFRGEPVLPYGDSTLTRSALSSSSASLPASVSAQRRPTAPRVSASSKSAATVSAAFSSSLAARLSERKRKDRERKEKEGRQRVQQAMNRTLPHTASSQRSRSFKVAQDARRRAQEDDLAERERLALQERELHLAYLAQERRDREAEALRAATLAQRDEERKAMSHIVRSETSDRRRADERRRRQEEEDDKENRRLEQLLRDASMPRDTGKDRRARALRELATGKARLSTAGWAADGASAGSDAKGRRRGSAGDGESVMDEEWTQRMLADMMAEYQRSQGARAH